MCLHVHAWIQFLPPSRRVMYKIQGFHYDEKEVQAFSGRKDVLLSPCTEGELVETVISLYDFEKLYKTSSSHALD